MGRLGDIADIGTLVVLGLGGYILYKTVKDARLPTMEEPSVPSWYEPHLPTTETTPTTPGIPGPALRDQDKPTVIDSIISMITIPVVTGDPDTVTNGIIDDPDPIYKAPRGSPLPRR